MVWPFSSSKPTLDPDLAQYASEAVAGAASAPAQAPAQKQAKREVAASRSKSLNQIAMDNCVEFERVYSNCLRTGSVMDRFISCQSQQQVHEKCVELQTSALQVLGYASASDAERAQIKARADDLMIASIPTLTISQEQEQAFSAAVQAAARS